VAFISYRAAKPDGDGGNHRTYQILLDLQAEFGAEHVQLLTLEDWLTGPEYRAPEIPKGVAALASLPRRMRRRVSRMTENPYKLMTHEGWSQSTSFGTRGVLSIEFVACYLTRLRVARGIDLCVVDHPVFDQLRAINEELGIPSVIASQNVESLDVGRLRLDSTFAAHRAMIDFGNELRCLSRYGERLAISKVEAALLTGVGLSCRFYPYVPRGAVRAQLLRLASRRQQVPPDRNLFLLVGTASHAPTRRSLDWFIRNAAEHGLPRGAHVVVVGNRVQELVPNGLEVSGLEVRGRVPDGELADLLASAGAALVPQRMGFGALTRISELACAGVPVLAFPHAAYAIDPPPGMQILGDDSWTALAEGIRSCMDCDQTLEPNAYAIWEEHQSQPLGPTLRRFATR
jgi:hypothetical protein